MAAMDNTPSLETIRRLAMIKFELLARGIRISDEADERFWNVKNPMRTRSGASGGLDVLLPHDVYVNAPTKEKFVRESPMVLEFKNSEFFISKGGEYLCPTELLPVPLYYEKRTKDGSEYMSRIGQMCNADRFCYGMTGPGCQFWHQERRCRFCSIGDNYDGDAARKKAKHMIEVLGEAISDPRQPAKHVMLGGGTPPGEDMGAVLASELCREIKAHFNISVYVMIAAPLKNHYIDMLHDAGVDELGMNIEFWSENALAEYCPGKYQEIGKRRYLEALDYAVEKFGPINTRSILIVGLEEAEHTIEGAIELASRGVMPILSPFRPLNGTLLEHRRGFSAEAYYAIFEEISTSIDKYDIPLGPTCICCQNNTLTLPFGKHYRFY